MHFDKKSHIILYIFFMYNEGKLDETKISEKDILSFFREVLSEGDIFYYLQQNIGDGFIVSEFVFDDPDTNGTYYLLTKSGVDKVREIFNLELEEEFPQELTQFQSLYLSFIASNLPKTEKEAYDSAISEIITCYKNRCLNAAISLCGKILEIYLTELLVRNNVEIKWFSKEPNETAAKYKFDDLTLNQLFILAKSKLPDNVKTTSLDNNQIELIKKYRNGAIHHNKSSIKPSNDVALGILHFTSHFLRHRLTWD